MFHVYFSYSQGAVRRVTVVTFPMRMELNTAVLKCPNIVIMAQVVTGSPGADMFILRRGKSSRPGPPDLDREDRAGRAQEEESTGEVSTLWMVLGGRT